MRKFDLFQGAVISVEKKQGKRRIWIHQGSYRFPMVNWTDLRDAMADGVLSACFDFSRSLQATPSTSNN